MEIKYYFDTLNSIIEEKDDAIIRLNNENLRLLEERNLITEKYSHVIRSKLRGLCRRILPERENVNGSISKSPAVNPCDTNRNEDIKIIGAGLRDDESKKLTDYFIGGGSTKIAVQAHVFYLDLLPQVVNATNNISVPFDLYITTCNKEYSLFIKQYTTLYSTANMVVLEVVENRGRDIAPFIKQMAAYCNEYEYVCHIHTKKSKQDLAGDDWRNYLFENLLGNRAVVEGILHKFITNEKIGIIFPETFGTKKKYIRWGLNYELAQKFKKHIGFADAELPDDTPLFPAGNMFWARTAAIRNIFEANCLQYMPEEEGQLDGTIMHAIERLWVYVAEWNGYECMQTRSFTDSKSIETVKE